MKWNKGAPPECGWYACKFVGQPHWLNGYRWWDGICWSWAAFPHETAYTAGKYAAKKEVSYTSKTILWSVPCLTNRKSQT